MSIIAPRKFTLTLNHQECMLHIIYEFIFLVFAYFNVSKRYFMLGQMTSKKMEGVITLDKDTYFESTSGKWRNQ